MKRETRLPRSEGPGLSTPVDRSTAWRHGGSHGYRRQASPTIEAAEEVLGAVEGGRALLYPSGMAATTGLVLALLSPGETVAHPAGSYYGTGALLRGELARWGVRAVEFDQTRTPPPDARLVLLEVPSNPFLTVPDVAAAAGAAHAAGALVAVDSTAATPVLVRPLEHGADVVVHSATKGLGGHSDLLAGALVTADAGLEERLAAFRTAAGLVTTPDEAWLLRRGMKTLAVRVHRQSESALELARRLASHPAVETVRYPGLSDPVAARLFDGGFGGLLSFDVRGGGAAARRVEEATRLIANATSLGGVESTMESRHRWEGDRVPEGLLRLSVGLEDVGDLWADLEQALGAAG